MNGIDKARIRMHTQRHVRVIKPHEGVTTGATKIVASEGKTCVTICPDELMGKWLELRRAYLAFEKFMAESYGIR